MLKKCSVAWTNRTVLANNSVTVQPVISRQMWQLTEAETENSGYYKIIKTRRVVVDTKKYFNNSINTQQQ